MWLQKSPTGTLKTNRPEGRKLVNYCRLAPRKIEYYYGMPVTQGRKLSDNSTNLLPARQVHRPFLDAPKNNIIILSFIIIVVTVRRCCRHRRRTLSFA